MTAQERIAELEAENAALRAQVGELGALREQVALLTEQIQTLQGRLAKDSHNSGKPPSSDGLARKTRSLRRPSGKKAGGQIGHHGETLRLAAVPDAVVEHRPAVCAACQTVLPDDALVVLRERRQVQELPPVRLRITEHQALHVQCPACQTVSVGAFPSAAPSRAQYGSRLRALVVYLVEQQLVPYARVRTLLAEVFGAHLSLGTLVQWVQQSAATLAPVDAAIKTAMGQAPVVHSDETGVRRAGHLAWAHVASTDRLTHYAIHAKRGTAATDAIGILPTYSGVSVHDGWKPYQANTVCRHALCNIHHLRELTFLEEHYQQGWANDLKQLLLEMKAATDQARTHGLARLPAPPRDAFVTRYDALMAAGHAANPPPSASPCTRRRRGRIKQSPARNLLDRLWLGKDQVLAFLDDLTIPFDNNQAERDLRMLKVQQKVSGCFRSDCGADAFGRIRGYLSTLTKQGVQHLAALETVCAGQPLYPSFA
jgi:transposase